MNDQELIVALANFQMRPAHPLPGRAAGLRVDRATMGGRVVKDWPCGWSGLGHPGPGFDMLPNCERCGWPVRAHRERPAGEPHHPNRWYLCDDPDCCEDGCPILTCAVCGQHWPCSTKREHLDARLAEGSTAPMRERPA